MCLPLLQGHKIMNGQVMTYDQLETLSGAATSGVTTAPATPAMQGGGTLGGRHIIKLTVF